MKYTGGKLVTATERLLVYLLDYRSYEGEMEGPIEITQARLAETLGVSPGNVGRAVRPLIDKELVETNKVHVPGIRLKRNVYYLSHQGRSRARESKDRILNLKITLVDRDRKEINSTINEIMERLPSDIRIIDILRETDNGVFDYGLFRERENLAERLFFDPSMEFSTPKHFFGRSEELRMIFEWCDSPSSNTLIIKGMPGIGKTTLIARILEDTPPDVNVFCSGIKTWTSPRSLLRQLSEFLAECGKHELKRYTNANTDVDLSEVEYLLIEGLSDTSLVLVFDDLHNADSDVLDVFSMLQNAMVRLPSVKLIVAGRRIEPFYDRKDVTIKKRILELTLEGLDENCSESLAKAVSVPQALIESIYDQTAGNPLFIELLSQGRKFPRLDIEQFIVEEFTKLLKKEELELLKYVSVYRYPVHRKVFQSFQPALVKLVNHSILTKSQDDYIQAHDVIKDALYGLLSDKELKLFHSNAAEHYLESSAISNLIEALHHMLQSGQVESAVEIILDKEEKLLKSGKMEDMARIISVLLSKDIRIDAVVKPRLMLMQAAAFSFIGKWDEALDYYRGAEKLAKGKEKISIGMKSSLGIAKIALKRNDYSESKNLLEKVLDWASKHKELEMAAEANYQLGSLYERQANLEQALKHFRDAMKISKELDDKHQLAQAHYGLGRIYHRKHKFEKALESREKALDIALKTGDEYTAAKILTGIGSSLTELERLDEAIEAHSKAIELARKNGAVRVLAYALSNIGAVYIDKPDLIMSSKYLNEALDLFEKLGEKRMVATVNLNMAINATLRGKSEEANELFSTGANILEHLKDNGKLMIDTFKYAQTLNKVERLGDARKFFTKALQLSKEIGDNIASKQIIQEIENLD